MKAIRRCLRRSRKLLDRERTQLSHANLIARTNLRDLTCAEAIKQALAHNAEAKAHIVTIERLLERTKLHIRPQRS